MFTKDKQQKFPSVTCFKLALSWLKAVPGDRGITGKVVIVVVVDIVNCR